MILVDFSNLAYRSLFTSLSVNKDATVSSQYGGLMIHILLQSIEATKEQYGGDCGDVVLCIDSPITWRSDAYPMYKRNRSKSAQYEIDWTEYWQFFNKLIEDIKECFPYQVFKVDNVEADDLIYHFVSHYPSNKHLIVSEDKDFIQVLKFQNTRLYRPIKKEFVVENNVDDILLKHICLGDKIDNIPSIMDNIKLHPDFEEFLKNNNLEYVHPEDTLDPVFHDKAIQAYYSEGNPIWKNGGFGPKTCDKFLSENGFNAFPDKVKQRFKENRKLIDLSYIPGTYRFKIANECIPKEKVINTEKRDEFFNKWRLTSLRSSMNCDNPSAFNDWIN